MNTCQLYIAPPRFVDVREVAPSYAARAVNSGCCVVQKRAIMVPNMLQGSVTTRLSCCEIFSDEFFR